MSPPYKQKDQNVWLGFVTAPNATRHRLIKELDSSLQLCSDQFSIQLIFIANLAGALLCEQKKIKYCFEGVLCCTEALYQTGR